MRIGLLSDTHGYMGPEILEVTATCDEIWHAGDIGHPDVLKALSRTSPVLAVYGNIDDAEIRRSCPEMVMAEREGLKVLMIHIAGTPGRYNAHVRKLVTEHAPDILVCGHSHILRVMKDAATGHWHLNPGAAGHHGFHLIRTMLTFTLDNGRLSDMAAVEFGRRGRLSGV